MMDKNIDILGNLVNFLAVGLVFAIVLAVTFRILLKKYDFINSLSDDQSKKLRMIFAKAEIIGNALATLEANGKEQKSLEKGDGQTAIVMDIFEKSINDGVISQEDYDELLEFIADA